MKSSSSHRRGSHRIVLLLPACILIAMCAACSDQPTPDYSTAQKTFNALVKAAETKDSNAYADCFVNSEQSGMREQSLDSPYDETRAGQIFEKGDFTVGMEEYYKDGKKVGEQPIAFIKEDGQWKASWDKAAEYREKHMKQ